MAAFWEIAAFSVNQLFFIQFLIVNLVVYHWALAPLLPPCGNSGDFDFWSSKSPLKAPPCGDCWLVKPLLFSSAAFIFISRTFLPSCGGKATTACSGLTNEQSPMVGLLAGICCTKSQSPRYTPSVREQGRAWLQMTSALAR